MAALVQAAAQIADALVQLRIIRRPDQRDLVGCSGMSRGAVALVSWNILCSSAGMIFFVGWLLLQFTLAVRRDLIFAPSMRSSSERNASQLSGFASIFTQLLCNAAMCCSGVAGMDCSYCAVLLLCATYLSSLLASQYDGGKRRAGEFVAVLSHRVLWLIVTQWYNLKWYTVQEGSRQPILRSEGTSWTSAEDSFPARQPIVPVATSINAQPGIRSPRVADNDDSACTQSLRAETLASKTLP